MSRLYPAKDGPKGGAVGWFVILSASWLAAACQSTGAGGGSGGSAVDGGASGGKAGPGTSSGGSTATGGATGSGGAPGSGGASSTGGASGTGGSVGSGGASATGGTSGGTSGSGGSGTGSGGRGGATGSGGGAGAAGGGPPGSGGAAGGGGGLHLYVSPSGTGTSCSATAPCSITQAQTTLRGAPAAMHADAIVELGDGVYPLAAPLTFGAPDSGTTGHPVVWQAATGARPILSGGRRITGWTASDSAKNIWKATAPADFATRQLFVDGKIATRARSQLNRADLTFTSAGFTFTSASLNFLTTVAHQDRLELHSVGSFTDRYSPVKSIAGGTATMVQPAWANNSWGYDTIPSPFRAGPLTIENAYELIDQAGEWYLDTAAGALYYKPLAGQDLTTADVELPQLEVLVAVAGTYDQPAHDLTFRGLTFSYTSWLAPNSTDGYANQQTGAFIFGSGYAEFEATRPKWHQMPAAVQVSAAKGISFMRDRFVALGQAALGIGNDDNAHLGKLGLGADTINVTGCLFTQIAAGPIVIGGIQENAHHPSDPRMTNQNMMVSNNLIHDVSIDYRDGAGLLFTYTKNVVVSHNELYNLPYSGIATGYGWGANDAGGSDDYATRGLYKYQMRYTTATIAQQNQVVANYLHDGMQQMNDGGCHYNLSANPMTVVTQNYCKGPWPASSFGDYEDEGSRYLTITKNVFSGWGSWATANANASNHTGDLMFTNNWVSGSQGIRGSNNTITGNITINGALPADAMTVVNAAGLEPAYADLKTAP